MHLVDLHVGVRCDDEARLRLVENVYFLWFLFLLREKRDFDFAENRHTQAAMVAAQVFGGLVELADETLIKRLLDLPTFFPNFLVASLEKLLLVLVDIFLAGLRGQTLDQKSWRLLQLGELLDLIAALTKSIHVSLELSYVDITLLEKMAGISLLLLRQSLRCAMTVIFQLCQ